MNLSDDDAVTTAGQICLNLAQTFAGQAASFAFGQMLSAMGVGTNVTPVIAELNVISQQIAALQTEMNTAVTLIAQTDYDTVAKPINDLIANNTTITGQYTALTNADTSDAAAVAAAKKTITDEMATVNIVNAPAVWNQTLCGIAGTTSLIEAWNRDVQLHNPNFGASASQAIQQHWDTLDAQQALSVMYAIEYYNDQNNADMAASTMTTYQANRTAQLGLLRGGTRSEDDTVYTDPASKQTTTVTTYVYALPPNTVVFNFDGAPLMCATSIYGPIANGDDMDYLTDFKQALGELSEQCWKDTGSYGPWVLLESDPLIQLLNYFGGSVGGSGADTFGTALQNSGFTFPPGPIRLWADIYDAGGYPYHNAFVDVDTWWNPSTESDDSAMVLFTRRLFNDPIPGPEWNEIERYWYPLT